MGEIVLFRPARDPRDRWPTIRIEPGAGAWWVTEFSASGDSGVLIGSAQTRGEALHLAREALHRDYGGAAHLRDCTAPEPEGAA